MSRVQKELKPKQVELCDCLGNFLPKFAELIKAGYILHPTISPDVTLMGVVICKMILPD